MAESNKIRFLFFVSLMIFPAHALDVILSGAHQDFKQKSDIKTTTIKEEIFYEGTLNPLTYEAGVNISRVIVYIIDRSRYVEIIRNAVRETRLQIADRLKKRNCELVFLGIENLDDDEHHLIGAFMLEKIQKHPNQENFTIETIGEDRFNHSYRCNVLDIEIDRYQENAHICGGTLLARIRSIRHGALKPVESDNKVIKLRGYLPKVAEVTWSVRVEDHQYSTTLDVTTSEYNVRSRHPNKDICILVLGGKEYQAVTRLDRRTPEMMEMRDYLKEMARDKRHAFYIMGAFNFDWTEIDIVTQIILKHTQGLTSLRYNICACGFGMFDTNYLNMNENDGRFILDPPANVLKIREALLGEEVEQKQIHMHYSDNGWKILKIPIDSGNGQYVPAEGFNFSFPRPIQRVAFIVYDSFEVNDVFDHRMVYQYVMELKRSNIFVVIIEAINFKFYDAHIIAEWIEWHRGPLDLEQIAVLGGGIFDTIFQSQHSTYKTFFDIGKHELKTIRNAYVNRGNEKSVFAANIDNSNFEVWSYPMNTVINAFYETDLIPDKNMFDTTEGRNILFIITSADNFQQFLRIPNAESAIASFRETIQNEYPISGWSVFLVGLDNFRKRDSHLFAELVKMQTRDERPLARFVRVVSYGISDVLYRYRDTEPFGIDSQEEIKQVIKSVFGSTWSPSNDTGFNCIIS